MSARVRAAGEQDCRGGGDRPDRHVRAPWASLVSRGATPRTRAKGLKTARAGEASPLSRGSGGFVTAAVASLWHRLNSEDEQADGERLLASAPDGVLRDLGLDRSDIAAAVRNGRERFGCR